MTYSEQLADPRWQRRRLERLSIADFQCEDCGNSERQLHVHHRQYFKGRKVWEYSDHELVVLCKDCHSQIHEVEIAVKHSRSLSEWSDREFYGLVAGFLNARYELDMDEDRLLELACIDSVVAGYVALWFMQAKRADKEKALVALLGPSGVLDPVAHNVWERLVGPRA